LDDALPRRRLSFRPGLDSGARRRGHPAGQPAAAGIAVAVCFAALALVAGFGLSACAPKPAKIDVTPAKVALNAADEKAALKAVAKSEKGEEVKDAKFTFASGDANVAAVSPTGEVTPGKKSGTTNVTVAVGEVKANVPVTVALYTTIKADPMDLSVKIGEALPVKASVQNEAGADIADAKIEWKSSDENIAKIDAATGNVTGVAAGAATLTLTAKKLTATVNVTVAAAGPAAIAVEAATGEFKAGETWKINVKATDAAGAEVQGVAYTFASSDIAIATVGPDGTVTGVAKGRKEKKRRK